MRDDLGLDFQGLDGASREWLYESEENLLFAELFLAEVQARKGGKRKTYDTHSFEMNLAENLTRLRDALYNCEYRPSRGTAHIITKPVVREIFAAPYVDRVVHHWIINNIIDFWEPRLSHESCSCRLGKGTSFGIERLAYHIRSVSKNYTIPCYAIKMDLTGYFMHIVREILADGVLKGLDIQFKGNKGKRYEILKHAISAVIFDDPVDGVKIQGSLEDWRILPTDKSLFAQPPGRGMVIGNLTSQFFSNIYLDPLDRFITLSLGYKHYGRYVDDFYIIVTEDELPQAKRDVRAIATFLNGIGMSLNMKKTRVIPTWQGVPFLGMVVKHGFIVPDKRISQNFLHSARKLVAGVDGTPESILSYLGMLKNYDAGKLNQKIFRKVGWDYNF